MSVMIIVILTTLEMIKLIVILVAVMMITILQIILRMVMIMTIAVNNDNTNNPFISTIADAT